MIHHLLMSGLTMIQQCSCYEESVHLSLPNRPPSLQYSYICSYSKKMIFHCHSKGCSSTNEDKIVDCSPTFSDLSVNCETRQTWVLFIKNGYEYLNSIYCRITMQISESIIWGAGIGEIIKRKKWRVPSSAFTIILWVLGRYQHWFLSSHTTGSQTYKKGARSILYNE